MRILKETLESLKSKGLVVSVFPNDTEESRWVESRADFLHCCFSNYKTIEDARKRALEELGESSSWRGVWYDATTYYIRKGDMLFKRSTQKSNLLDEETILKVVEREEKAYSGAYGDFAKKVNAMLQKAGVPILGYIYPTTYGIGVWIFYNFNYDVCRKVVENLLGSRAIEYRTEYSEAKYVLRYIISKKEVNRAKL